LKDLLIRTLTGISLVVLVVVAILTGPLPFLLLNVLVFSLGIKELYNLFSRKSSILPNLVTAISSGLMLPAVYMVLQFQWSPFWFLIPLGGWVAGVSWSRMLNLGLLSMFWIAIPLGIFFALGYVYNGNSYQSLIPLTVIILVWVNDTFAYLTGSLLGRHPMTPRLSPGKTWEGFAGGVMVTLLGGWIMSLTTGTFSPWEWVILSLMTSLMSLMGDLFESGLKRNRKVKDTGAVLPGHGGILDRFDSLFFVAPVLMVLFILFKNWI
jgi:phosphatidate cytidylyltransferase